MTDYMRLKTVHGTWLQVFPDGTARGVENPGPGATFEVVPWREPTPPEPPPPGELVPITYGLGPDGLMDRGDFLRPYFGPACVGSDTLFAVNLASWQAAGHSAVLLNGSQDPWMLPAHPEWGIGFKWWKGSGLTRLVDRCRQLRAHGIMPHVSCFDQPDIGREGGDGHIDTSRGGFDWPTQQAMFTDFVQALNGECSLINYTWEWDERHHASDDGWMATEAIPTLCRIVHDVNPRLRFAIHTARREWGGFNLYGSLPPNGTRYWQAEPAWSIAQIEEVAHKLGPVHRQTNTQCVVMEHSPSTRLRPIYTQEQANARARAAVRVLRRYLPDHRIGSLNGDPR